MVCLLSLSECTRKSAATIWQIRFAFIVGLDDERGNNVLKNPIGNVEFTVSRLLNSKKNCRKLQRFELLKLNTWKQNEKDVKGRSQMTSRKGSVQENMTLLTNRDYIWSKLCDTGKRGCEKFKKIAWRHLCTVTEECFRLAFVANFWTQSDSSF